MNIKNIIHDCIAALGIIALMAFVYILAILILTKIGG
jgi:hypothetical protein